MINEWTGQIHEGDMRTVLREMPGDSVHMVMTSPPYWQLRDYGSEVTSEWGGDPTCDHNWTTKTASPQGDGNTDDNLPGVNGNAATQRSQLRGGDSVESRYCPLCGAWKGQFGLEPDVSLYVDHIVEVGEAIKRVLRPDGSWWLNLGDTYDSTGTGLGLGEKQLGLIPQRAVIALQEAGWTVRNVVIWKKVNPMPSSVKDRLTTTTERLFHLTLNPHYYYDLDAIREPHKPSSIERATRADNRHDHSERQSLANEETLDPEQFVHPSGKNPGDVIELATKPFSEAHFACVSDDTEILTKEGWKTHDELRRGEKVATYDIDADRVELEPLSSVHTYNVDTELLHVGNRDLDILMTKDHRNVTQHNRTGEIRVRRGYDLAGRDKILVHAPSEWETNAGIGEPLAELVGWIIAEAHYRDSGGIRLYQQEGDDADRIRSLLTRLGVPHNERTRREAEVSWHIPAGPWADAIRSLAPEKQLTQFLASMPEDDLQALFDGLVRGDGHIRKDDGRISFTEKNPATRNWFQVIAFRLGYHAIDGTEDIHCTDRRGIGIRGTNGKGLNVDRVDYEGVVWCPKTPNGTWVARRNGRPFITGNTYPPELCTKPIKATAPKKVCASCGTPYTRQTKDVPLWEMDPEDVTRQQAKRALELADEHDLSTEHLKAARTVNIGDSDGTDGIPYHRVGDDIAQLAKEAKDVLGGYYREFAFSGVVSEPTGWEQRCDCDTDEARPGIVLDPFAGSGATLLRAKQLNRRFIGVEMNSEYVAIAQKRIGLDVKNSKYLRDDDQTGLTSFVN